MKFAPKLLAGGLACCSVQRSFATELKHWPADQASSWTR
jgi:hypothetical protein